MSAVSVTSFSIVLPQNSTNIGSSLSLALNPSSPPKSVATTVMLRSASESAITVNVQSTDVQSASLFVHSVNMSMLSISCSNSPLTYNCIELSWLPVPSAVTSTSYSMLTVDSEVGELIVTVGSTSSVMLYCENPSTVNVKSPFGMYIVNPVQSS